MQYYYFHGFGSSPFAKKCLIMKKLLGNENVSAPDFNVSSIKEADALFTSLIKKIKPKAADTCIVGSSLGGLYALYVSAMTNAECVLLNPCLFPQIVIPSVDADVSTESIVYAQNLSLKAYAAYTPEKVRVWVTKDDELIDHKALTKPFFHRGCAEYMKMPKKTASKHEFKGFRDVLKKYL